MFATFDALWAHMGQTMTQEQVDNLTADDVDELTLKLETTDAQLELLEQFDMQDAMSELIAANVDEHESRVDLCERFNLPLSAEDADWADSAAADYEADVRYSYEQAIGSLY